MDEHFSNQDDALARFEARLVALEPEAREMAIKWGTPLYRCSRSPEYDLEHNGFEPSRSNFGGVVYFTDRPVRDTNQIIDIDESEPLLLCNVTESEATYDALIQLGFDGAFEGPGRTHAALLRDSNGNLVHSPGGEILRANEIVVFAQSLHLLDGKISPYQQS